MAIRLACKSVMLIAPRSLESMGERSEEIASLKSVVECIGRDTGILGARTQETCSHTIGKNDCDKGMRVVSRHKVVKLDSLE
jgi:hypothetical protein